jgi:hypothetical protein
MTGARRNGHEEQRGDIVPDRLDASGATETDWLRKIFAREVIMIAVAALSGAGSAWLTMRDDLVQVKAQLAMERELRSMGLQAMASDIAGLRRDLDKKLDDLRDGVREDIRDLKRAVELHAAAWPQRNGHAAGGAR